ncbi:MAG: hypothetical protein E3J64_09075, partial [Anaerolineales bacterium]
MPGKRPSLLLAVLVIGNTVLTSCTPDATATPEPTPAPTTEPADEPTLIESFEDVPEDVLLQVCEDVKAAVDYDDEAGTVTIHLVEPFGPTLQYIANGWTAPIDMEWMAAQGGWDGDCSTWANFHDPAAEESILFEVENGTGPYLLDEWVHGEEIRLVAFQDYYRTEPIWDGGPSGPARIENVVIKNVSEWGTRFAMLQAGDTDTTYVPREYAPQVDPLVLEECDYVTGECTPVNAGGTVRLFKDLPSVGAADMFFNFDIDVTGGNTLLGTGQLDGSGIPPDFFADIHIRKAFNYCFDWETLIEDSELGEAEQRMGPIINPMPGYEADDFIYSLDPVKAEEEFKLADLDHDGIPAGEDEEGDVWSTGFYFVITYNTGNVQERTAAEILKANVEAVNENFQVEILAIPFPTFMKGIAAG